MVLSPILSAHVGLSLLLTTVISVLQLIVRPFFLLSSTTLSNRSCCSFSDSAIRTVSSAYPRFLIFHPTVMKPFRPYPSQNSNSILKIQSTKSQEILPYNASLIQAIFKNAAQSVKEYNYIVISLLVYTVRMDNIILVFISWCVSYVYCI